MKAPKRTVGILGGMGPEATILLMQKIVDAIDARDDADHIPLLVDQNSQVPSRIRRLIEGTGPDPAPVLARMAKRLETAGAEALAMPCNTAHHYSETIRQAVSIPFIDMVELSVRHARDLAGPGSGVGILASPAVRRVGLFEPAFAKAELTPLYATDEDMTLRAIQLLKREGPTEEARKILRAASAEMFDRGASVQMIACTEFSLIAAAVSTGVPVFDTLGVLVDAIVDFSKWSCPSKLA